MAQTKQLADNSLTRNESLALRGICITLIVLHNLVHNVFPVEENEKVFKPENVDHFLNNFFGYPILDSLSYLGWLGVPIFFFLSGYGLSKKYGQSIPNPLGFIKDHYLKLLLLAGPFILLKNIKLGTAPLDVLGQLTFLNNLFKYTIIQPRAFWYLRVAFQLYILYALILRRIPAKWLMALALVVTCSLYFFDSRTVFVLKFHSVGWLLDFALGVFFAQHGSWLKHISNLYCSVILLVLLVFASINWYAWFFSTTIAVLFFLSIRKYLTNKPILFVGSISAFLYVTHPLIRDLWLRWDLDYMNGNLLYITLSVCAYFLITLAVAYLYSKLYKKILAFFNDRFSKKQPQPNQ